MNALEIRGLRVGYDGRNVVTCDEMCIAQNQFVALLGPNGAGKTTLLRTVLGLVPPQRGSIAVLGLPAGKGNRAIGYVPQTRTFPATACLTGYDFVASAMNGHRWGWPSPGRTGARELDRVIAMVDATALAHHSIMDMSGGERQRLLLAQALLGQPRLLLLDEPLISLDLQHQRNIIRLVKDLQEELGITVIFSAHEINPLLHVVDQVLYLGRGQMALGSVDSVITSPVLSRLYGTPIDVLRHQGRIFVMAETTEVASAEHCHDV